MTRNTLSLVCREWLAYLRRNGKDWGVANILNVLYTDLHQHKVPVKAISDIVMRLEDVGYYVFVYGVRTRNALTIFYNPTTRQATAYMFTASTHADGDSNLIFSNCNVLPCRFTHKCEHRPQLWQYPGPYLRSHYMEDRTFRDFIADSIVYLLDIAKQLYGERRKRHIAGQLKCIATAIQQIYKVLRQSRIPQHMLPFVSSIPKSSPLFDARRPLTIEYVIGLADKLT